ncbi:MAG TPA: ribosome-recycling factor [Candidatus Nitrosocosmicus sp.]|nr:ribosome-recycling factor [Candidatus Nitrosocosmicus sp.]
MFNESQELSDFKNKLQKSVDFVRSDLQALRTGKTSPGLVENIVAETYGGSTKLSLRELATITTEGPGGLLVAPFDISTIQDIERAIRTSPLGLQPIVEGKNIHLKVPPLNEEQRKQILKIVSQKIEEGKEKLRAGRDEIRKKVKQALEGKEISEDQRFRVEKEIDKITQESNSHLEELKVKKEKEIMEI